MKLKSRHWLALLLCCTLPATPSLAKKAQPWYEVEIIIFTRDVQPDSLGEMWPSNPGTPDFGRARPLQADPADKIQPIGTTIKGGIDDLNSDTNLNLPTVSADENNTAAESHELIEALPTPGELPALTGPKPYALLPEEELRLKREFSRLQRSPGLHPEIHLAWRQPVSSQKKAPLLYLQTPYAAEQDKTEVEKERVAELATGMGIFNGSGLVTTAEPPDLEGTIRISVSRYLHVELDLLRRIRAAASYSSYEQSFEGGFTAQAQPYNRYRMQAHRRMRSGELHYIDHPLMGVLIKITPYELPIPAEPVEPEATAPTHQVEEANTAEPDATAAEQEPVTTPPEPGVTRSIIEIPARQIESESR
ncbi:MAG: peptidoglycan binding protein CsiV [Candidatus Polarisedimenticolaceae bacterium]|nr:peptidoglycan binding protein CsiV [Candidatus Polarisedimenticolaceae bacterium]